MSCCPGNFQWYLISETMFSLSFLSPPSPPYQERRYAILSSWVSYCFFFKSIGVFVIMFRSCHICPVLPHCHFALGLQLVLSASFSQMLSSQVNTLRVVLSCRLIFVDSQCHFFFTSCYLWQHNYTAADFEQNMLLVGVLAKSAHVWDSWQFLFYLILLKISFMFFFQYFICSTCFMREFY